MASLVALVAVTVLLTLAVERRRTPAFAAVGKAMADTPVALHREPSESTATTGMLEAGEPVEILQYLPPNDMDSWLLIRSTQNPKIYGYARLGNLDHLETTNGNLDLWHATQLLEKAAPADLQKRLAVISEKLKTPPPASPTTDEMYRILAGESLRLANEKIENPDEARVLAASAEDYLNRISSEWQITSEIAEVRSEIQKVQIALGDIPDPSKPPEVPVQQTSQRAALSRILKEANAAFQSGRYGKAAELSQQVSAKGQGNKELAALVDQAKALQRKAEAAQEEFEKVNIQNR